MIIRVGVSTVQSSEHNLVNTEFPLNFILVCFQLTMSDERTK